ncbi:MAG: hypothetical protein JXR76_07795 [Deltaproteobacteria bacterium]|nr:hypothetical protein [Deltaproteobacteria bacterium]
MRVQRGQLRRTREQRGGTALIVTILLVVLLGSVALVVDLGNLFRVRTELQTAADAAALAGAPELDGSSGGLDAARAAAMDYAAKNPADDGPVELLPEDVTFGHWNLETSEFTDMGAYPDDPMEVNAIKVLTQRSAARGDPVELTFAGIFGKDQSDVSADAIALGCGPAEAGCPFPLVISECSLTKEDADAITDCEFCMVFQNNNSDNAGWTSLESTGVVGNPKIADLIVQACYGTSEEPVMAIGTDDNGVNFEECAVDEALCNKAGYNDQIQVNNGNILNTGNNSCVTGAVDGCNNPCPVIQDILLRGHKGEEADTDPNNVLEAKSFVARVPVVESDISGPCTSDQYSGQKRIIGFAAIEFFGARCSSTDLEVLDSDFNPPIPCTVPPSGDYVAAVLKCDLKENGMAGGGIFGLSAAHFRLVK